MDTGINYWLMKFIIHVVVEVNEETLMTTCDSCGAESYELCTWGTYRKTQYHKTRVRKAAQKWWRRSKGGSVR